MESVIDYIHTLTRVGADITSSLVMKTTTELCRQKRRRIQACSHNRAGIVIYIMGVGGGRRQRETVILCISASAVSYRVAVIRKKRDIIVKRKEDEGK